MNRQALSENAFAEVFEYYLQLAAGFSTTPASGTQALSFLRSLY